MSDSKRILKKIGKILYMIFKILFAIIGFATIVLLIIFLIKPSLVNWLITMIFLI